MKTIAILYQGRKEDTAKAAAELAPKLQQRGYQVHLVDLRDECDECFDHSLQGLELGIVLGGDGTILHAARVCAQVDVPILGVDFGRVGFLTELQPQELANELDYYLERDGSVWIDKRSMLCAELNQGGQSEDLLALNDMVIARGMWPRVVEISVWIDDHLYNTTHADGIILSTATGSTAYNMAVGGPLLHPQVQSIVITPIAPHLAFDRALILPPEATIKLQIGTASQHAVFSADGQSNREIQDGATITVYKSEFVTKFLRRRPPTYFYQIINAKLRSEGAQQEKAMQHSENSHDGPGSRTSQNGLSAQMKNRQTRNKQST